MIGLVQPNHHPVLVTESDVDQGNARVGRRVLTLPALEVLDYLTLQFGTTRYARLDDTINARRFTRTRAFVPLIHERLKFELRGEAYNLLNSFTGADPDVSVTSSTFGKITSQRSGLFGRQIQFSGRLIW